MNFENMRTQHDWIRIQGDKRKARPISGRVGGIVMPFWKAGCQQYRNWISEPKQTFGGLDACIRRSFGYQIQGIEITYSQAFRWRFEGLKAEQAMSAGRKPNPFYLVDSSLPVNLIPTPEPSDEFQKRREEVQDMIVRILLTGKKRGRPSKKEEYIENAA